MPFLFLDYNYSSMRKFWQTSQRKIDLEKKTLVMAILNVTPDSFSDGGEFIAVDDALKEAKKHIIEGADILDIGGESTRPQSKRVSAEEELERVLPVIEEIKRRFDVPISIDTTKSIVAEKASEAGAEIINDISGLRFDERIAKVSAKNKTGLVLMHSRGEFETMHKQKSSKDILRDVKKSFGWSIKKAKSLGVKDEQICLDVGIGFGKTFEQNLELIAKLDKLCEEFSSYPMLIGTSRKSFIGKILKEPSPVKRLNGTLAADVIAVWKGANIVRVHDVKAAVEALKIVEAVREEL